MGSLDPGVAMSADRAVPLIVGHHEDDVGAVDPEGGVNQRDEKEQTAEFPR